MTEHGGLRAPGVGDAERIGEIQVAAWQAAYRGIMPDDYLDGLSVADRAGYWRAGLAQAAGVRAVRLIAVDSSDTAVGFLFSGPAAGDAAAVEGEVYALNVDPGHWAQGAGTRLLRRAEEDLAGSGFATAVLWVVPGNHRARRFYEHHGWSPDGQERTAEVFGVTVDEVRYRRDL